jgi:protein-tyrosine phosphatase/arsenate reductase
MFPKIEAYIQELTQNFDTIPAERKVLLQKLTDYIQSKIDKNEAINLNYICTHNSRRSHFGQVWSKVAADYYGIKNISTFSGGTEATAFNSNAINSLKRVGFEISQTTESSNPVYQVFHSNENFSVCFSKTYDHEANPKVNFAAIMTCSDAEENCPFIPGVDLRIGTTYNDPKAFDGTTLQDEKYLERSLEIAKECLYTFSLIKN